MRRPAQHHLGPIARTGWAHPYRGIAALAVFHNDGGQGGAPAVPAVPTPADVAARAGQQPAPGSEPAPLTQRISPDDTQVLIDKDSGQPMTQGRLSQLMTKQFEKSRRNAFREMAEAAGIPYDPDTFDPDRFGQLLKDAQEARQAQMTDEQRRADELATREQQIQAREEAAQQRESAAAQRDRDSKIRAALVSLGATGDDLDDAAALIRVADDADDAAIAAAATALKERRSVLFGGQSTPQTLPPAPSGSPAGGNAPRQPVAGKDAVKEEARKWAEKLGYGNNSAA